MRHFSKWRLFSFPGGHRGYGKDETWQPQSKGSIDRPHPMSGREPAMRDIAIPSSAHPKRGSQDLVSVKKQSRDVRRLALSALENRIMWHKKTISDPNHGLVQKLLKLRTDPAYRRAKKMASLSHKSLLRSLAEDYDVHPKQLMLGPKTEVPPWADPNRTEIYRVEKQLLTMVTGREEGISGQFDVPTPPDTAELMANTKQLRQVLVLDNVQDPHQLGSALRLATSFAWDSVFLIGHCVDIFDHDVVLAAGAVQLLQRTSTPFYVLRSEDGDDIDGLLNHVAERNNLRQVMYAPRGPTLSAAPHPASLQFDGELKPKSEPRAVELPCLSLDSFCFEHYYKDRGVTSDPRPNEGHRLPRGHMLIAGPDHRRTLAARCQQRLKKPTTQLTLDEYQPIDDDFGTALPSLLYSLRHSAGWDYLPISEKHFESAPQLQQKTVDIGVDRMVMDETTLNEEEDEYMTRIRQERIEQRNQRLEDKTWSDTEYWIKKEQDRIEAMGKSEKRRAHTPWKPTDGALPTHDYQKYSDPRYEKAEIPNRDIMRDVFDWAENYRLPPNYELKTQNEKWKVRNEKVRF